MGTFLIADDSRGKTVFLRTLVQRSGWTGEIVEAQTTEEAKALIDAHPDISAAFIDYYLPSENGPAVIRYLRRAIPTAKIALVSSSDNQENAAEARDSGADAVVCTGYHADVVERKLSDLLQTWSAVS